MSGNRGSRFDAGWLLKKITKVKKKIRKGKSQLRSHGKTGDCEKSNEANENVIVECKDNLQSQKSIDVASRGVEKMLED